MWFLVRWNAFSRDVGEYRRRLDARFQRTHWRSKMKTKVDTNDGRRWCDEGVEKRMNQSGKVERRTRNGVDNKEGRKQENTHLHEEEQTRTRATHTADDRSEEREARAHCGSVSPSCRATFADHFFLPKTGNSICRFWLSPGRVC